MNDSVPTRPYGPPIAHSSGALAIEGGEPLTLDDRIVSAAILFQAPVLTA
jgi:hypothetical protein